MKILAYLFLFVSMGLPWQTIAVDTGPKPTMNFQFVAGTSGNAPSILGGSLLECQQSDCRAALPLEQAGPQHFSCEGDSCEALAYSFSPYHQLQIQFSDGKTRQSNIFQTAGFNSQYTVTIRDNDLLVQAQFNLSNQLPGTGIPIWLLLVCCAALCLVVVIVAAVVLLVRRAAKKQ